MTAGGYDAQLNARVNWDIASTEQYIAQVESRIARLGAEAPTAYGAGELISNIEGQITRIAARVRAQLGAAVAESFNFEGLIGRLKKPLDPFPGATVTRLPGQGQYSSLSQVREGYTNDQARQAQRAELIVVGERVKAEQAALEAAEAYANTLRDQVVGARDALAYQQFVAGALRDQGALAVELLSVNAQSVLLTQERNAALKVAVEAEKVQQYLRVKNILPGTNMEAALKPERDAIAASEAAHRVALAQRVATKSVGAESSVEEEEAEKKRAASEEFNKALRSRAALATRAMAAMERADAEEAALQRAAAEEFNAVLRGRAGLARRAMEVMARADEEEAALKREAAEEFNAALRGRASLAQRAMEVMASADAEEEAQKRAAAEEFNAALRGRAAFARRSMEVMERADEEEAAQQREAAEEFNAALRARAAYAKRAMETMERADAEVLAQQRAASEAYNEALRGRAAFAQRAMETAARADEEEAALKREAAEDYNRALRERAAFARRSMATGALADKEEAALAPQSTTFFQRFQANLSGGDAGDKKTLGNLLGGNLLRTGGFLASGALLFGGLSLGRNIFQETEKLQVEMAQIKSTMEETGTSGTDAFNKVSDAIIGVSRNTATSADEVAALSRRLAGVFATPQGTPDFTKGVAETQAALKLATVTGLPKDEITNDLVAISKSFDVNFTHIGDTAIGLARDFGGSAADIIKFTGSLAPMARDLGFTSDQLAAFGAVTQEFSGQSAQTLTAEFTRVLPAVQGARDKVVGIFSGNSSVASKMVDDFSQNNIRGVLLDIIANYNNLSSTQQDNLNSTLGLRRGADALYAAFEHGDATLKALNVTGDEYAGLLGQRFGEVQDTMSFKFAQLGKTVEDFGVALFNSGIAQGLGDIAGALGGLINLGAKAIDFFSFLNDHLGGIPGHLAGIAVGLVAIGKAMQLIAAARAAGFLGGVLGAAPVAGAAATGLTRGSFGLPASSALAGKLEAGTSLGAGGAVAASTAITTGGLIIGALAVHEIQKKAAEIGAATGNLDKSIQGELAKGTTPAELRRRLDQSGQGDFSNIETAGSFVTGNGGTSPKEELNKQIDDWRKKQYEGPLKALQDGLAGAIDTGQQVTVFGQTGRLDDPRAEANVKDILNKFTDDPAAYKQAARNIVSYYHDIGRIPDAAFKQINDIIESYAAGSAAQTNIQDDLKKLQAPDLANRVANVTAQFNAGLATPEQLQSALQPQIDILNDIIAKNNATGSDSSKEIGEAAQLTKSISDAFTSRAQQAEKIADALAGVTGSDTGAFKIEQAEARLKAIINNPQVDPSAKVDAILNVVNTTITDWTNKINRETNKYGVPLNPVEKAAELRKGFEITPEMRKALDEAQLLQAPDQGALQSVAPIVGQSVEQLTDAVATRMAQTGEDAKTILTSLLEGNKKLLEEKAKYDLFVANDANAWADDLRQIGAIDKAVADIQGADVGTHGGPTADQQADADAAAVQYQRQQDQANANAKLDIQAAAAHGNAVQLAQIAQERAHISAQFASSEADSLAAQAQMIQANQALAAAYLAHNKALRDLSVAQSGDDPIVAAQAAIADSIDVIRSPASGPDDVLAAQAALVRGEKQQLQAYLARDKAIRDLTVAQSGDDPLVAAQAAIDNANEALANASNPDEAIAAQAELVRGEKQLGQAILARNKALRDLAVAQTGDDPIAAARAAIENAYEAVASASNPDEAAAAQAELARAQKQMADAVRAGIDAQFDLLIAIDNFNGDAVKAAQETLRKLQERLNDPNLKLSDADRLQLQAQIQSQELQVAQTQISQGEQDINNALELGKIGKAQAIAQLGALKGFAVNQREITEIDLEIKRLKDQLGQDYKFNLPSVLGLPTLYEARRTSQDPSAGGYADNRVITITVVAQTNADPNQIAAAVQNVMGPSQTFGVAGRRY